MAEHQKRERPFDILLAGIGIGGLQNTTALTIELLNQASVIFSLTVHRRALSRIFQNVVALDDVYYAEEDGGSYSRIESLIISEARKGATVALVDDGHPMLMDQVTSSILYRARRYGLQVRVAPAISSIDVLLAKHPIGFDETGTQIVEANALVENRQRLDVQMHVLVLQIGWFGTQFVDDPISRGTVHRLRPLQKYLARIYGGDHRVKIMRAGLYEDECFQSRTTRISKLCSHVRAIESDSSLYVPPIE